MGSTNHKKHGSIVYVGSCRISTVNSSTDPKAVGLLLTGHGKNGPPICRLPAIRSLYVKRSFWWGVSVSTTKNMVV